MWRYIATYKQACTLHSPHNHRHWRSHRSQSSSNGWCQRRQVMLRHRCDSLTTAACVICKSRVVATVEVTKACRRLVSFRILSGSANLSPLFHPKCTRMHDFRLNFQRNADCGTDTIGEESNPILHLRVPTPTATTRHDLW